MAHALHTITLYITLHNLKSVLKTHKIRRKHGL